MLGYEKVNKRVAARPAPATDLLGDPLSTKAAVRRPKKAKHRRFVDFRAVAGESPAESIAREQQIVTQLLG